MVNLLIVCGEKSQGALSSLVQAHQSPEYVARLPNISKYCTVCGVPLGRLEDRAIEREHQAAISSGGLWPLGRKPEAGREGPDAAAPEPEPQPGQIRPAIPEASTEPESSASKPGTPESGAAGPVSADDGRAARLDGLQVRADEAARRIDAQRAQLDASSKHTARIEREAQAEPEAARQADTSCEMDR